MKLIEIHKAEVLYECIYSAFAGDKKLISKYHVKGDNLDDCVRDTYNKILETSKEITLDWYAVCDEERVIGYLVVSLAYGFLYSFGISINYREHFSGLLFSEIKKMLKNNFTCILWTKNSRGINYLVRNGMKIVESDESITKLINE